MAAVAADGWTVCWSATYGSSGHDLAQIFADCGGGDLMMAGWENGSSTYDVAAAAGFEDVTFATSYGDGPNQVHTANGVDWYFNGASWGFASQGDDVHLSSCDYGDSWDGSSYSTNAIDERDRLCWHTSGGTVSGGWRSGDVGFLNGSSDWNRALLVANVVPIPAAVWLFGSALAGLGWIRRKRTA
jgi:hypothetical protein